MTTPGHDRNADDLSRPGHDYFDRGLVEQERERVLEALRVGEERAAIDESVAAIHLKDLEGRYLEINRPCEALFRFARGWVVGETDHELFPKKMADAFRANDLEALEAGSPLEFEESFLREDGEHTSITTRFPLYDSGGNPYAVCGISTGIVGSEETGKSSREVEAGYRALVDGLPELICRFLPDEMMITWANEAYCHYFGKSREELVGHSFLPLLPEEDREPLKEAILSLNRENPEGTFEHRVWRADGEVRWQQWTNRAVYDERGDFVEYQAVGRDFSVRKLAEEALKESEERLQNLTDATFEGIAITENGEILETNLPFADMFGYELSEVRGLSALEFHTPENRDRVWEKISSGCGGPYESKGLKKDGSTFDIEVRGRTATHKDRSVRVSVIRDITERKQAEEALKEREEWFRSLVQHGSDCITVLDADGVVRYEAPSVEQVLGYKPEDLIEKRPFDFVHPDDADRVSRTLAEAANRRGVSPPVEFRVRHADGSWRWMEMVSNNLLDNPSVRGIVCNSRDTTERKLAEEALKESEERYRRLVEGSPETIAVLSEEKVVFVNAAGVRLAGVDGPENLVGKPYLDFVHPDFREDVRARISRAQEGETVELLYQKLLRPDGRIVEAEAIAIPTIYEGKPAVQSVIRDITGRKEAEAKLRESEIRFRSVVHNSSEAVKIVDLDGTLRYASPAFEQMFGYRPEEMVGVNVLDYVHPEDLGRVIKETEKAMNEPGVGRNVVEYRFRHADGSWRHVESAGTYLLDEPGIEGVVVNARDITERKQAEEALKESEERFRGAFEDAPIGVALVSIDMRYLKVNQALCEMLGYSEEELLEKSVPEIIHPEDREISSERARQALEEGLESYTLERRYVRAAGGGVAWNLTSVSLVRDFRGEPSHFVCLHQDVTERKALEERLRHRAFHDPLTDLPNRVLFLDRLQHALARSGRLREPVAVLFVDLDDFKVVNDSLGHEAGNLLLAGVGERLRACVRPGDTVARLFGDEFAVLLEAPTGMEEARQVTGRIGERLQAPFDLDEEEVHVTPSIGIVLSEAADEQPEELLRRADLAMYAAKSRGKARQEIFTPSMNSYASERLRLENELRRAVKNEEFEVYYQPIIEMDSGKVHGLEALLRWRHPERGLVTPAEFIPIAEEIGLIRPMSRWVLERACRQAREWRVRYPETPPLMGVNLSTGQFSQQPDLVSRVLLETGLEPGGLQLEITERIMVEDAEFALGKLRRLKSLGVRFAIDDYGMGYSCLYYLKRMPVDFLKIDRSFITGLGKDPGDKAIVSGTIDLAHALGLKAVAEGVETADQFARLKGLGCDLAQGFYLAEPLPSEAVSALLSDRR